MTVLLRAMRWQDLSQVSRLEQMLHPDDAWSGASWWAELALRPRRDYLVAHRAELVLGYAGVDLSGASADLMSLAVTSAEQGRGVGGRLLRALHGRVREAGADSMVLEVREDNRPALALYERHGYRLLSRRRAYYRSGQERVDALVLRMRLAPEHAVGEAR